MQNYDSLDNPAQVGSRSSRLQVVPLRTIRACLLPYACCEKYPGNACAYGQSAAACRNLACVDQCIQKIAVIGQPLPGPAAGKASSGDKAEEGYKQNRHLSQKVGHDLCGSRSAQEEYPDSRGGLAREDPPRTGGFRIPATVIPDVPDLAPNANRSMRARPDDPYVQPKRSPETRYDEQRQNI